MANSREATRGLIIADQQLKELGLLDVYQADSVDAPTPGEFPFGVIRWLDETVGMGAVTRRPFSFWVYGPRGDYDPLAAIGSRVGQVLKAAVQTPIDGGHILQFDGGLRGADLADEAWDAAVVPYSFVAVAKGL